MAIPLKTALSTAEASTRGGRDAHGGSSDGVLDLFALGYAACFQHAMSVVGRQMKTDSSSSEVTGRVTLGAIEGAQRHPDNVEVRLNVVWDVRDRAVRIRPLRLPPTAERRRGGCSA